MMESFAGIGPAWMVNSANSPGLIAEAVSAVQVICETASVIGPSSVVTGVGSFALGAVYVQPGLASIPT